jgi:hypothetical protein
MYRSYFKIGLRNLLRTKGYSLINIGGLAMGMAIAILIGLWITDELTFNQYHKNYGTIVQFMKGATYEKEEGIYLGQRSLPYPLLDVLKETYGDKFKHITAWYGAGGYLTFDDKSISVSGAYVDPGAPDMLSLKMLSGVRSGLQSDNNIMLSASTAKALFGDGDPLNRILRIGNTLDVMVTGVYEDIPYNSTFKNVQYLASWELCLSINPWIEQQGWQNHFLYLYGELAPGVDLEDANEAIHDAELRVIKDIPGLEQDVSFQPFILANPMSSWHLYSNYREGSLADGPIEFVRIVGIIGVFVLLLACINFLNLSTARSA